MTAQSAYRPEIDGLRSIAVVPVILFHAGFGLFSGGFVGVDIFFVISGFLITSIIAREMQAGRFSLLTFYERRARRILPALFLIMLLCLPVAWQILVPRDLKDFAQSLVAVSTFTSNILFWRETGYFGTEAELKPLLHTWSLAVEEQFYIFFPLLLMALWRFGRRLLIAVFLLIFVASLIHSEASAHASPATAFYLLPSRAWELLIGSAGALWILWSGYDPKAPATPVARLLSLAGMLLILGSIFTLGKFTPFPGLYAIPSTLGTLLILLFARPGSEVYRLLAHPLPVGIGLISYSAYLWHQPIFAFVRYESLSEPSPLLMGALCLAVFPLAWLSWRFVETPFRVRRRIGRGAIFSLTAAGLAAFIAVGLTGHVKNGFDDRLVRSSLVSEGEIGHQAFYRLITDRYSRCTPEIMAETAPMQEEFLRCLQSSPDPRIDIAIIGDSLAEHLFLGLAEGLPDQNVVFYVNFSMPLLSQEPSALAFRTVLENPDIHTVVMTMSYEAKIPQLLEQGRDPAADLEETLQSLKAAGKKVVLIGAFPNFWFDPYRCAYSLNSDKPGKCEMNAEVFDRNEEIYADSFREIARRNDADYIDMRALFCSDGQCSMRHGNTLLFRDDFHLNTHGSRRAGGYVIEQSAILSALRPDS